MKVVISSGHGKYIRGASGYLDEVDEARRVVEATAAYLIQAGVDVITFHDNVSTTQDDNLEYIVHYHNSQTRDLDISVHFNAYQDTTKPMGAECWYYSQEELADRVSEYIARAADLPNRGGKSTTGLYFLNNTEEPAILIETCFVDSSTDSEHYLANFEAVCRGIAGAITDRMPITPPTRPPSEEPLFYAKGRCSWFGGPADSGVSGNEGLAFFSNIDQAPQLFLPIQPPGTTGLARRLNPAVPFVACRWDYDVTPKDMLRQGIALVRAGGVELKCYPADWGPHQDTGRVADLSKILMSHLKLQTDDEVEVIFPCPD